MSAERAVVPAHVVSAIEAVKDMMGNLVTIVRAQRNVAPAAAVGKYRYFLFAPSVKNAEITSDNYITR